MKDHFDTDFSEIKIQLNYLNEASKEINEIDLFDKTKNIQDEFFQASPMRIPELFTP